MDLNSSFNSISGGGGRPGLSRSFVGGNNFLDGGNSDDEEDIDINNRGGNILDLDLQPVISLQSNNNNVPHSLPYR